MKKDPIRCKTSRNTFCGLPYTDTRNQKIYTETSKRGWKLDNDASMK